MAWHGSWQTFSQVGKSGGTGILLEESVTSFECSELKY